MTTVITPVWAPWTTYYDPSGQGPGMTASAARDGLNITYQLDPLALNLERGQVPHLAAATGLSGSVSVDLPPDFNLVAFRLVVTGYIFKTASTEAMVSCSIGTSMQSLQWSAGDTPLTGSSNSRPDANRNPDNSSDQTPVTDEDFILYCFTNDSNPPLAPMPVTLGMQVRRRTADETVQITINTFTVDLLGAP